MVHPEELHLPLMVIFTSTICGDLAKSLGADKVGIAACFNHSQWMVFFHRLFLRCHHQPVFGFVSLNGDVIEASVGQV